MRKTVGLSHKPLGDTIMRKFKKDAPVYFDCKDAKTLARYINIYGQIEPIAKTGLSAKQQRQLATAIKRSRHLAFLPFVAQG